MDAQHNAPAWLKAQRVALGYTQGQMAKALGMSLRSYQQMEGGFSSIKRYHALAVERVLDVCKRETAQRNTQGE